MCAPYKSPFEILGRSASNFGRHVNLSLFRSAWRFPRRHWLGRRWRMGQSAVQILLSPPFKDMHESGNFSLLYGFLIGFWTTFNLNFSPATQQHGLMMEATSLLFIMFWDLLLQFSPLTILIFQSWMFLKTSRIVIGRMNDDNLPSFLQDSRDIINISEFPMVFWNFLVFFKF